MYICTVEKLGVVFFIFELCVHVLKTVHLNASNQYLISKLFAHVVI